MSMIVDDDPSSSMIVDTPSANISASTALTKDAPSHQSAPLANPSASTALTKGNSKRKRTQEQDGNQKSKKHKKRQQKKGKRHANTEESDAKESNEEEEEEEAEFNEMSLDVETSEGDENVPLRLTMRTTARQLAKDADTDSSMLISCDQSLTQGP